MFIYYGPFGCIREVHYLLIDALYPGEMGYFKICNELNESRTPVVKYYINKQQISLHVQ